MRRNRGTQLSLKWVLTVPYVLLVIALAGAIGCLSYYTGTQATSSLSEKLLRETVGRITQAIDRHIVGSSAVLEAAFPVGLPAPANIESTLAALQTRFWVATSLHTQPNDYVYYGNQAGQGLGLLRQSPDQAELRIKLNDEEHRAIYHLDGIAGTPHFTRREKELFDPRTRPWYLEGLTNPGHSWTSVYVDFGTRELVATRARRVLSATHEFAGVVATDLSLKALNDFVSQLRVSPSGIAYIIEPSGELIASSATPNVVLDARGQYARLSGMESGNPLLTETFPAVMEILRTQGLPEDAHVLTLDSPTTGKIYTAFDLLRDDAGLEWVTIVAVPASDLMANIHANARQTALLGGIAVIVVIGIGLAILGWVASDLRLLQDAAHKFGRGDYIPIEIHRRDELGELARSFERMQQRLRTDGLTGLMTRDSFIRLVEKRIESHRQGRHTRRFALLFIDLNRFKQINDTYGHDAGDKALQEVAGRLRDSLRVQDHIGRYAGDEFIVFIDDATAVQHVQKRIADALNEPLRVLTEFATVSIDAAVGAAIYPDDGDTAETLLRHADQRMYQKKTGDPRPDLA